MRKITFLIIITLLVSIISFAQVAPDKYYIQFTDKNDSPYSIDNPGEFLTQRSLDRRAKYSIQIIEQDLPVNPLYLEGVAATGAELLFPTKWLNGVTIYTTSSTVIDDVLALPYVVSAVKLISKPTPIEKEYLIGESFEKVDKPDGIKSSNSVSSINYGSGTNQIAQLNGILLHDEGFMGQGMVIAVLDGGFVGVETQPLFDSLWANNQILGVKDFAHVGGNVYTESGHGRAVLSCMGANIEGQLVGTAPKASYWLLRSEYVLTENVLEEYNWVSAAEFADSVGADVINSSLSYQDFDMPIWDHTYEDLDGNTAVATIGADIAVSKGILVVNSAGNSGNSSFPWCAAPADGHDVFTLGAVDSDGDRVGFSSIGPTVDGRIKPDVMALGQGAAVAASGSGVTYSSGTSFSSPIMAGMTACLIQAYPERTPLEIRESLKQSGNSLPNNYMGWGIPDFMVAYSLLTTIEIGDELQKELAFVYPNPFSEDLTIRINNDGGKEVNMILMDVNGRMIFSETYNVSGNSEQLVISNKIKELKTGIYFLGITIDHRTEVKRIVKK